MKIVSTNIGRSKIDNNINQLTFCLTKFQNIMKKFFSFFAALLFAGSMMAEEATMTAGTNGSACTVNDVAGIKCGTGKAGGDMTITVGAGATKLSFYAAAWKGVTGLSLNLAADGVTFSPASVSLTADDGISNNTPFTLSGLPENFKFEVELTGVTAETTIAVTSSAAKRFVVWGASYEAGEAPSVATPVISGEAEFTESTQVSISCTTEGAAIYYTLDGADPTTNSLPYGEPFTLTETATVKAVAYDSENSQYSAIASKTFTKKEPLVAISCAEVYRKAKGTELALNNVVVAYANGKNVYVQDETGSMLLYLTGTTTTWAAGNILSGVEGTLDIYNDLYEVKMTDAQAAAVQPGQGEAPAPVEFNAAPVAADMNKYILLKNVKVDTIAFPSSKNMNATIGDETFVLRNNFNADVAFDTTKLYDITGVVSVYKSAVQVYFINATEATVAPVHTYTVAGGSDVLFGTTWAPANTANDMALVEGLYTWEKSELTLAAGNIEFKVCEDHGWDVAYPAQNYELAIAEAGIYTVTITFNAETKEVAAIATKTGEAVVVPTVAMHGNFLGSWADTENFAIAQDNASASLTLTLAEGNYEFGMRIGGSGNWTANGANLTREANTTNLAEGSGNMHIAADVAGDYVFTYTYETQVLEVVYPEAPGEEINVTISSLTNPGQVFYADAIASSGYWDIYAFNDQYQIEISNISTTEAAGTYTIDDLDAKYTYIVPAEGDTVHFTAGQVVLSITDGVVNVAGKLTGDDNNIYNINLTYKDPVAEQTVNVNIPKGVLHDAYAAYGLYAVYGSAEDGTYVQLAIWAEAGFEGEFTEDDLDNQYVGSGLKDAAGNTQQIYTAAITVTPGAIEGAYTITADLLCYNNTLYKVTMKIGEEQQGIEDVEAAVKAIKRLVNGQVVIEKAGKSYNMNGAVIR